MPKVVNSSPTSGAKFCPAGLIPLNDAPISPSNSGKLLDAEAQRPVFLLCEHLLPRNFALLVARHAPSMQLSAVSTPSAIWLCAGPETMLAMKVRSLSRSAYFRLSRNAPFAANCPEPAAVPSESFHDHAFAPVMPIGPAYGHVADPLAPKSFRPASKTPSQPNCVDANVKCTSFG